MIRSFKKLAVAIASVGLLAASMACTAFAAEERTPITSLKINVQSDLIAGEDNGDVQFSCETEGVANGDKIEWEFKNYDGEWKIGDYPVVELTLEAKDDYYFKSLSSSKVKLSGSKATYQSSSRKDQNSTLIVKIKLDALGGTYQLEDIEWAGDDTAIATWVDPENAGAYQIKLYRNGNSQGTAITTKETEFDFSNMITKTGDYTFRVRTYVSSKKHGEYEESGDLEVTDENINAIRSSGNNFNNNSNFNNNTNNNNNTSSSGSYSNYWYQDASGSWKIRDRSGNTITNCWVCDDAIAANGKNVWYLIGADGKMITEGLVRDKVGNYYSIEINHNGYYGMLRYKSGTYDGVNLTMNPNHDGAFGALDYQSANALYQKYGKYSDISYIPTTCKYTSQF